jgi:hypothetical protein
MVVSWGRMKDIDVARIVVSGQNCSRNHFRIHQELEKVGRIHVLNSKNYVQYSEGGYCIL